MNVVQAFRILELHPNASQEEVKQAFKRLAKQFHPDVCNYDSTAKFQRINNAYEVAYEFAGKNKKVHKPQPPAKTKPAQPVRKKRPAAYTRNTSSAAKTTNKSSNIGCWLIIAGLCLFLLILLVPGLQLIALFLLMYGVTRIL